jgi:hypothetical protein
MTYTHDQCRVAAEIAYGEAGVYAVEEFDRINRWLFDGALPPTPIVIGLTAYGRTRGFCRGQSADRPVPRITLHPLIFGARNRVTDMIIHEMLHAFLMSEGREHKHNTKPWCEMIEKLSPAVLGLEIHARPVNTRSIGGVRKKAPLDGHLEQHQLASWPGSLRPYGWDAGEPLAVDPF